MEEADLVIIGAGWFGLSTAKTYLELNPSANVVVLDSAQSVGGVWAKERVYPTLKSNNLLGCYEFWDYPMDPKLFDVTPGKAMTGDAMHEYFASYVENFGLTKRIRLGVHVESAEKQDPSGWLLTLSPQVEGSHSSKMLAHKLVVATGLTSDPFLPSFEGQEKFEAPIIHSKYFKANASTLTTSKVAVVFGGTKSGWDAAYAYADAGADVHWVIRSTGHGPTWMSPPFVTPLKRQLEKLVLTRFLTWFSPCIFADASGYGWIRRFLQGTWLGRKMAKAFWAILMDDLVTLNQYDNHPDTKKLKPMCAPFWIGTSLSILNYDQNIFDMVRSGKIKVHVAQIDHLSKSTVHLDSGVELPADILYCATGWKHKPPVNFLPEGIDSDLGLPTTGPLSESQQELRTRVDNEIKSELPLLADSPKPTRPHEPLVKGHNSFSQGYHLYRFMLPPKAQLLQRRDIAFAGSLLALGTAVTAQIQALWITAYFNDSLRTLPPRAIEDPAFAEKIEYQATLWARFNALRHPATGAGFGEQFPDLVFENLPYLDVLLRDLGLQRWRKKGGPWNECFGAYGKEEYMGLVEEYKRARS